MNASFCYPIDGAPVLNEFDQIATREDKKRSGLLWELILDYVRKHSERNPPLELDKFMENRDFKAFPTLGEDPTKYLEGSTAIDLKDLKTRLNVWARAVEAKQDNLEPPRPPPPLKAECPYNCGQVYFPHGLDNHLSSHHRDEAIRDGHLKPYG